MRERESHLESITDNLKQSGEDGSNLNTRTRPRVRKIAIELKEKRRENFRFV
jgi:hypothetical protein